MAAIIVTERHLRTRMRGTRSRRPKYCKLAINSRLRRSVAGKLGLDWSPEQIAELAEEDAF